MEMRIRPTARLCWTLHAKQGVLLVLDLGGALLFVVGCVVFYTPSQYAVGVTFFLVGSLLMLVSVAGRAFLRYGPSR